jgi:hypothetical protein
MKRSFPNQILAASVIAACVGCSRTSHLYSIGTINVPTAFDHFWSSSGGYYIGQCRVPFDAQGREFHDNAAKVTQWRTFTEIGMPGHCWSIRGPIWMLAAALFTAGGAVFIVVQSGLGYISRRFSREKHGA